MKNEREELSEKIEQLNLLIEKSIADGKPFSAGYYLAKLERVIYKIGVYDGKEKPREELEKL